jgi:hypothetical protein
MEITTDLHLMLSGAIPVDRDNLMLACTVVAVGSQLILTVGIKTECLVCSGFQVFACCALNHHTGMVLEPFAVQSVAYHFLLN